VHTIEVDVADQEMDVEEMHMRLAADCVFASPTQHAALVRMHSHDMYSVESTCCELEVEPQRAQLRWDARAVAPGRSVGGQPLQPNCRLLSLHSSTGSGPFITCK
jgi:hypothetical protein